MAMTTKFTVPYDIYALTKEVSEIDITENFDTEMCLYPKIAMHSDTKFVVTLVKNIETEFDTKLRIRSGRSLNRVALVFN